MLFTLPRHVTESLRARGHQIAHGSARLRNPYRLGLLVHPSNRKRPGGRKASDTANQHTDRPVR